MVAPFQRPGTLAGDSAGLPGTRSVSCEIIPPRVAGLSIVAIKVGPGPIGWPFDQETLSKIFGLGLWILFKKNRNRLPKRIVRVQSHEFAEVDVGNASVVPYDGHIFI